MKLHFYPPTWPTSVTATPLPSLPCRRRRHPCQLHQLSPLTLACHRPPRAMSAHSHPRKLPFVGLIPRSAAASSPNHRRAPRIPWPPSVSAERSAAMAAPPGWIGIRVLPQVSPTANLLPGDFFWEVVIGFHQIKPPPTHPLSSPPPTPRHRRRSPPTPLRRQGCPPSSPPPPTHPPCRRSSPSTMSRKHV